MSRSALFGLVLTLPAFFVPERARAADRPAPPVEVTLHQPNGVVKRETVVPGEWVLVSGRPHVFCAPYRGGKELRFEWDGPRLFVRTDGGEPRLEGVVVEGPDGRAAAQKAIADKVSPLTVACSAEEVEALPPAPETVELALYVWGAGDFDASVLAAKFPGLWALGLRPQGGKAASQRLRGLDRLPRLTSLRMEGLTIEDLGPVARLKQLTALYVAWQSDPADMYPAAVLENMRKMGVKEEGRPPCPKDLTPLAGLSDLRSLSLSGALDASDLRPLSGLTKLACLSLAYGRNVTDLSPLAELSNLAALGLQGFKNVSDLAPLARLSRLTDIYLRGFDSVSDFGPLAKLTSLTRLEVSCPPKMANLEWLNGLKNSRRLRLEAGKDTRVPSDLSPLAALTKLRELWLSDCTGLTTLKPLANLAALEELYIIGGGNVSDLAPLAGLGNLEHLEIYCCDEIEGMGPVGRMPKLRRLKLVMLPKVHDLTPLGNARALTELRVWGCGKVKTLEPLRGLTQLRHLSFRGNERGTFNEIEDLGPLSELTGLTELWLYDFPNVTDLGPLARLKELRRLGMIGLKRLESLAPLAELARLEELEMNGLERIVDLSPLARLEHLSDITMINCERVRDLTPLRHAIKRGAKLDVFDHLLEKQLKALQAETGF